MSGEFSRRPSVLRNVRKFGAAASLTLLALLYLTPAGAAPKHAHPGAQRDASPAATEADLKRVRARIDAIRRNIQAEAARRDSLVGELQTADAAIRDARERGADLRRQRQDSERKLADARREQAQTERQIAEQRAALAAELKLAYMNGREEQLKLLLNQQDPAEAGRMMVYYKYFGRARAETIAGINAKLAHLQELAATVEKETDRLRELEQQQNAQIAQLAGARKQRATLLAGVQAKLHSRKDQLATLQRQAAELTQLIDQLRAAMDDFPSVAGEPFGKLRGKLPWPVKGKVTAHFGDLRAGGPLKWEGVVIEAPPGTPVRAPLGGRVVYADWLNGMGYLVILDHGGGYLSLYGHNEQLYRKVGDLVASGDVIGELAERGDGKAELYMEIRKAKRPIDPERWLRKR